MASNGRRFLEALLRRGIEPGNQERSRTDLKSVLHQPGCLVILKESNNFRTSSESACKLVPITATW